MSKKQWMVLLMLFLTYLLLGASIFYHIESNLEIEHIKKAKEERIEINALLHEHYVPSDSHDQHEILEKLTRYCGKSVYNYTEGEVDPLKWDFYNSFYFAYTVVSTIGYGNLAPTNMLGRILMIFYGLIGIPMNGILLTQLGEFFSHVFVRAHRKYKSYKRRQIDYYPQKLTSFETRKLGLAAQIFLYLTPGFVMFIFFPAFLFSHYEGWTYDEAVYYAFVTLTTIGFGDYVAGQDNSKGSGVFFILYKTFLICWISFGLGYIVMIMTFIARGMRSKKITRIEHKLAMNIKHTQSKIWNEFNKEVNYLRRVFNELQLSKVKRVYVDECDYELPPAKFPRSNSFPDLRNLAFSGLKNVVPQHPRRRANSEVVPTDEQVTRVVSETDLQRIDKTATFAAHAMVQPAELLARLVNILGYIPPPIPPEDADDSETELTERGRENNEDEETKKKRKKKRRDKKKSWEEGGTDSEGDGEGEADGESEGQGENDETERKKSKEKKLMEHFDRKENGWTGSFWRIGSERIHPFIRPRSRAASEIRLREARNERNIHRQNGEWTWSGPVASKRIQELINAQTVPREIPIVPTSETLPKDGRSYKFPSFTLPKSVAVSKTIFPRLKRQLNPGKKSVDTSKPVSSRASCERIPSPIPPSLETGIGILGSGKRENDLPLLLSGSESRAVDDENNTISGRAYFTHTGTPDISTILEGNNLLEETSLADFLRALTIVRTRIGKQNLPDEYVAKPRRKMGTASLTPPKLPSLFTLFSPVSAPASAIHSEENTITSAGHQQSQTVHGRTSVKLRDNGIPSHAKGISAKPRRFSLRPVLTSTIASNSNLHADNVEASTSRVPSSDTDSFPRTQNMTDNTFLVESAKQSLVKMESTPGISTPVSSMADLRRFSLASRTNQSEKLPIVTNAPKSSVILPSPQAHAFKVYPRWKAGMLQRQIGRRSIRRRERAFSLSDVSTERNVDLNYLATPTTTTTQDSSTSSAHQNLGSSDKMIKIVPVENIPKTVSARTAGDEFGAVAKEDAALASTEYTSSNEKDYEKSFLVKSPLKDKSRLLRTDTYNDTLLQVKVEKPVVPSSQFEDPENVTLPNITIEKLEKR